VRNKFRVFTTCKRWGEAIRDTALCSKRLHAGLASALALGMNGSAESAARPTANSV
jgi:hypothetical protein